jgi:hypothetical protein
MMRRGFTCTFSYEFLWKPCHVTRVCSVAELSAATRWLGSNERVRVGWEPRQSPAASPITTPSLPSHVPGSWDISASADSGIDLRVFARPGDASGRLPGPSGGAFERRGFEELDIGPG